MDERSDLAGVVLGGRYELHEPIGAGGMAVVWRARDHVLARTVAVKIVGSDRGEQHRIRREAQAAAGLSHPNIAQVHDYGELTAEGRVLPYVVMELVEGGTLADRMADGPVPPRQAMRICAEIAAALAAAHALGLVHRDIKPANVMLGPTGAKVVDFGIAAATAPSGTGELDPEVLGTPAYLAPERLIDDAVEPASDVYALGVVLYRLLSGHSPWSSEDTTQMLTAHIYLEPAPLPPVAGVPAFVAELCERCLIKDPTRRPSAREVSALLSRGATHPEPGAAASLPGGGADATAKDARPRHRGRLAVAAALLLATGAAGWLLIPDDPPDGVTAAFPSGSPPPAAPGGRSTAPRAGSTPGSLPTTTKATATTTGATPDPAVTRTVAPVLTATPTAGPATPSAPVPTRTTVAPPPGPGPDPEPVTRAWSSDAGSLTATCPSPATAEILTYQARKPFKVQSAGTGPSAAPAVTFKHGNAVTTMTVTCSGGQPAMATT
ncbi:serine/threonine-protein kinase [Paractinoplanes lichenicola]|uniref:non-specific serine/threonine protein kinase n=1 Tax=Paractinoplanes lichenicola TaxID=2802976 RepID=A0ABS1VYE0_9ACTN|nr:serine/threonine-protein kinase [Actinoplanes lichenicola]MBL7259484.1 serine/threonine protein kinase [Actinoplanes lichenicola]